MDSLVVCPLCRELTAIITMLTCEHCKELVCDECAYSRDYGYICASCKEHHEE